MMIFKSWDINHYNGYQVASSELIFELFAFFFFQNSNTVVGFPTIFKSNKVLFII